MYDEIYETFKEVAEENINRDLFNNSTKSADDIIEDIKNSKIVIYTAFTGGYDSLKEPEFIDMNCDYVCFTDNPDLTSDTWKIIQMDESTLDNNRKAKQFKVLPHKYFPDYKYSFWLDGTFKIKGSLREYIYKNIKANSNMLCVVHTERDCIYDEYEASKIIPRYPRSVMKEQVETYKKEGFPKHYGMGVMGSIFRKHNSLDVIEIMEAWWDEIIKYTNQDQLSFAYVCWKCNFHPSVSLIYYWDNEYWAKESKNNNYHHNTVPVTPITSQNLLESLRDKVDKLDLGNSLDLSKEELYLLLNDVKGLAGYRIDTAGRIGFLNNEYTKILASNSMKITKPLRTITNFSRKIKSILKNNYLKTNTSIKINNLNLINRDLYNQIHHGVDYNVSHHFVRHTSKTDDLKTKKKYINPLFDLSYYQCVNKVFTDPLIHYVEKGFDNKLAINRNNVFISNLNQPLNEQYSNYINSKIQNELDSNNYITNSEVLINYLLSNKKYDTDTIKVGVFLEDSYENMNACPYIRIHSLFKNLSKSGNYHFFIYGQELMPNFENEDIINDKIFDIVVIQRYSYFTTQILKQCKRHGIKVVYETDDDLININHEHPNFNYISSIREDVLKLVFNADAITVSTNQLASKFRDLKITNVNVIKNYYLIDVLKFKPFTDDNNRLKIGYFGTITHDDDLDSLHNVFIKLKEEGYEFDLEVIGGVSIESDWYKTIPLPFYPMPFKVFMEWVWKITNWDIGIIPLVDSEFNNGKSELKFIEFTALGVPVVASPRSSYEESISDHITGFLAHNESEWFDKIRLLLEDASLRHAMYNNAKSEIFEKYNMDSRIKQWDDVFKDLIDL